MLLILFFSHIFKYTLYFTDEVIFSYFSVLHNETFCTEKRLSRGQWIMDDLALKQQSWQATPENKVIWETLKELTIRSEQLAGENCISNHLFEHS